MRRIALLTAGVAVLAGSLVLVEPMVGAATLKPGLPTNVKASPVLHSGIPLQSGAVKVTWTAPKVVKGKTAKATTYFVQCGSVKATTTKTTVTVKNVANAPKNVQCSVQAKAGKVSSNPVKAKAISVYSAKGALAFEPSSPVTITATTPGLNVAGMFSVLPTSADLYNTNLNTISTYGSILLNNALVKNVSITEDASSTNNAPVVNVTGTDITGATITIGQARDLNMTTGEFTFYAPTDTASVTWYGTHGVTFANPGQSIGLFMVAGQSDL